MKLISWKNSIRAAAFGCAVLWSVSASTQDIPNINVDSLENVLKTAKLTPIEKMKMHYELSYGYSLTEFKRTVAHARKGITIAEKENEMFTAGDLYCNIGEAYYNIAKYDTALIYFKKALNIASQIKKEDIKSKENIESRVYGSIANVYNIQGKELEAIEYYLKVLPIFEKNDRKGNIVSIYGNIAYTYYNMENYDQAEKYFSKAEIVAKELNDSIKLGFVLVGQSEVFIRKGNYAKALEYAEIVYRLYHSSKYRKDEVWALQQMANVYYSGYEKYDTALVFIGKALAIAEEAGYPELITGSLNIQSSIYYQKGQYAESEQAALKALEIDSTDLYQNAALYALISRSNIMLGNKEKAIRFFEKYLRLSSVRINENYQSALSEMEVKYETEKKEMKIAVLEKEKRLTTWIGIIGGALLFSIAATLFFMYRSNKNKKKLAQQQVKQLEQEKQLVAIQAVLDGETSERTRLARDLHDGLGGMLSVVKLNLNEMKEGVMLENTDVQRFDAALKMLDDSIGELRRVSHNMMPDSLSRYGLKAALTDFCNSVMGAEFNYFGNGDRLDPKLEVMIYRTIHELVNNVLKHAGATRITVQVVQETDRIAVTVQDDGCGFDTAVDTLGTGLKNIRNRVTSYNGRMDIYSKLGEGTEVNVEFIFPEKNN